MIQRRQSKQIEIGNIKIGGGAPISVQSMTNTDTRDVESTLKQINNIYEQGCELVRLAILNPDAAEAIKEIKKQSPIPLIADIHFDYRLAIRCIENGIDALRINPGNIGKEEHTKKVVALAKTNNIPIRIGINGGSLEKELEQLDIPLAEKMVMSAMRHVQILEDNNFDKIKISLKSSDVLTTIEDNKEKKVEFLDDDVPEFKNILIENIECSGAKIAMKVLGLPQKPIHDILVRNSNFTTDKELDLKYCENIELENVNFYH